MIELEPIVNDPDLWSNPDKAKQVNQEAALLRKIVDNYNLLESNLSGLEELYEMASEDEIAELDQEKIEIEKTLDELYKETLFSGKLDNNAAILTVKPGAGGTESSDWAGMLFRMYLRFAERKGFKVELLDLVKSDTAPNGIDYVQMIIRGERAFGFMQVENGVHRLVRVSPFDSQNRRHTSFASVEIMPEIDDTIEIEIDQSDVRIDVYRSSGPGGQSVNTTDSAVRLVYKAGTSDEVVVTCQDGKSQIKNKEKAFKVLRSRLWEKEERKRLDEQAKARGEQKAIEWGSQIRSYVLDKQYIKDHRSGEMYHNPDSVLDGDIEELIWAGLEHKAELSKSG